jgi:KDO2-lipid IV(A) lauroyltransferase
LRAYVDDLQPSVVGKLAYYCLPYRRKVVLNNLRQAFSSILTESQIRVLAMAFYAHVLRSLRENISMRFQSLDAISQQAVLKGVENIAHRVENKQGFLLLTGHFGNWELAPIAGILNFTQFKGRFHFIRRTLKMKWLEKILFRRYFQAGLHVIPKKNSLDKVCAALDNQDAVVFVMDQHASLGTKDGIAVDFFGKQAGTYRSLATIAQYTQLPVIPVASYRQSDGQHVLEFLPPIPLIEASTRSETLALNTRAYNAAIEEIICRHPEQWWWVHRRWKL